MIDIRKLKELVRLMVENDLSELNLQDQQETVTVKRAYAAHGAALAAPVVYHAPVAVGAGQPPAAAAPAAASNGTPSGGSDAGNAASDDAGLLAIESPMVGTFYLSPNPDSPPFVASGGSVEPETTVCLIEAMKVFNEIKAEVTGVVERCLVSNGQAVEYGQKLFLIRPS